MSRKYEPILYENLMEAVKLCSNIGIDASANKIVDMTAFDDVDQVRVMLIELSNEGKMYRHMGGGDFLFWIPEEWIPKKAKIHSYRAHV